MNVVYLINISFFVDSIKEYKPQVKENLTSFTKEDFEFLVKKAKEIDEKYNPCDSPFFLF